MNNWEELVQNIWQWFEDKGLHDPIMQYAKVNEEIGEIGHELTRNRYESNELLDAIGDSMVTLIGLAHHLHVDPYLCLAKAYDAIKDRTGIVVNDSFVKDE